MIPEVAEEYVDSRDDLDRKYVGTFVKYQKEIYWVDAFANAGQELQVQMCNYDKSHKPCIMFKRGEMPFEEIHLDSQIFNVLWDKSSTGMEVAIITREPRRQWKRSICRGNTTIRYPANQYPLYQARLNSIYEIGLTSIHIRSVLEPFYFHLEQALVELKKHPVVCLSPNFYLALHTKCTNKYLLGSVSGFIGEFIPDVGFDVYFQPAIQEVKDYLHRTRQNRYQVCPKSL